MGSPGSLVENLTFTQNIHLDRDTQRTFSHAWSLCIEEQFYLLLPFLSILIAKTQNRYAGPLLMVILVLFGWAIRVYSWDTHVAPVQASGNYGTPWFKFIYYPTYNRLDPLLAGVAITGIFSYFPRIAYFLQHKHRMTLTGGLLLLSAAYFLCRDFMSYHASIYAYPIIAGGYGLLVLHAISTGSLLYRYPLRLTAVVAKLSYALYLVHKATIHLSQEWFSAWGVARESNLMFFLSLATSLAAAALLHFIIEKPFHNIREQILHRRAAKQARVEPAQKDLVQAGA
jgi:peptidoglycan/LPS O-acetylase OafA/YrhL